MKVITIALCLGLLAMSVGAWAVTTYSWEMAPTYADLSCQISNSDLINGQLGVVDGGFHSASSDQTGAGLTDGVLGDNLRTILNDMGAVFTVTYNFDATQLYEIRSFAGNDNKDGRVFQNVDVSVEIMGSWFPLVTNATTGPFYTKNDGNQGSLIRVFEQGGGPISEGDPISGVKLTYYNVDNTQNWFVPIGSNNICATIVKEVDVFNTPVPEPCSMIILLSGVGGLLLKKRSR